MMRALMMRARWMHARTGRAVLCTAVLLAIATAPATAQVHDGGSVRADVSFAAGIPQGELDDRIEGQAIGVTAFVGGPVPETVFVLGSEIGYLNYGSASRLTLHETVFDAGIDEELAVPLEAVNTTVSNNLVLGHLVARLQPADGTIQPYVDVLAGIKYFATRLNVESDVIIFGRGISQDAYVTDFALSYGLGGGIEIELYEQRSLWDDRSARVSLYGGLRYLFGASASYAAESAVRQVGDRIVVDEVESRTDMLVPQFGLRVSR